MILRYMLAFTLLTSFSICTFACTMVMAAKGDVILAGNNEDWKDINTRMWFVPASGKDYGRVCFGFGNGWTQGGMNDKGLFIDANALAPTGWKSDPDKSTFTLSPLDYVLSRCATVDEAAEFFKKYNHPSLAQAKFPIADAFGGSIVVEWGRDGLQIVKRDGRYQISTNFVQSNFKPEDYPCERYKIAEKIFNSTEDVSVDLVRSILSATHQEWNYPTVYSNIYDLKTRIVYLYNFHNFEEVHVVRLEEELRKGKHSVDIPSLFLVKTQAANQFDRFRTKPGSDEIVKLAKEKGIEAALAWYREAKEKYIKMYQYDIGESELIWAGTRLSSAGKNGYAIAIFKLTAEEYPDSWSAYLNLGLVFEKKGEVEKAIDSYRKTLVLKPDEERAKANLARLEAK
jgi:penicillin V acylase-like amidase (Ntn superfamily)